MFHARKSFKCAGELNCIYHQICVNPPVVIRILESFPYAYNTTIEF